MAPGRPSNSKRKRSNIPESREATSTPPKRRKKAADRRSSKGKPTDFIQSSQESEPFYEAKAILKEEGNKYLIDWADHPTTGETYAPTWEPKRNANKLLVEDWRRRQREEKNPRQASVSTPAPALSPATAAASPTESSLAPAPQPKHKSSIPNRRRVIQNSSPGPHSAPNNLPGDSSLPSYDSRIVPETELRDTRPRVEPAVHITHLTDYNPSDYEHISASQVLWNSSQTASGSSPQLQQSRPTVESSQESAVSQQRPGGHTIPAKRLLQRPRFGSGVLIPDSQSLPGDSSYVPSTQTRSGAESQSAQTQSQPPGSANAPALQDSSASASAQFTNPQEDDSSVPVPETDPIEDEPSSPATHSHHEERHPPPRESPWHTTSSASSPPPTESPVKSTQSEGRVASTQAFVEAQAGTPTPAEYEHAQDSEAEVFSGPLSPKSRPEDQRQPSPEVQEPQQTAVGEYVFEELERKEEVDRNLRGIEEQEGPQDSQVLVPQSLPTEDQQYEQPEPEVEQEDGEEVQHEPNQEGSFVAEATPAVIESAQDSGQGAVREDLFADRHVLEAEKGVVAEALSAGQTAPEREEEFTAEVVPTFIGSTQDIEQEAGHTEHQHERTGSTDQSTDSEEARHFVTCPERTTEGSAEVLVESAKRAEFSLQDQAEISTRDVKDPPENTFHLQFAQRDFAPRQDFDSAASRELEEHSSSEHHVESLQPAQYVPELDLDGPQSSHRTQISEQADPPISSDLKHTQSPRRKDSSQDNLEPSVLGQADPNVIRRPYGLADSDVPTPKDIVPSVETRGESPLRGYYRKVSRGMHRSSQAPNSSVGGTEQAAPTGSRSLTERLREIHSRSKIERERKKAEHFAVDESVPKSPSAETSTRSPSTIPPNVTQTNMEPQYTLIPSNLSAETRPNESHLPTAQNDHDMPDIHHLDDDTDMHDGSTPSILLDDPIVGDAEYLVGLSMEGLQGDQYRNEITFKENPITHFLEDDPVCETHAQEVRGLLKRLNDYITHMDLGFGNADALTQYEGGMETGMVAWSNNSSTKFRFLGGILQALRDTKYHFVVLGCQGPLMDILEKYVDGLRIPYSRGHTDREAFEARESLFVTILASDFDNVNASLPKAHLIFAMDSTVQCHDPKMKALRNHLRRSTTDSIPVITPIVTNSIEHVERCISPSVQGFMRERLVVRFTTELRQLAGRVEVSTKADQAVRLLVPSIESDLDHHEAWPLLRMSSIKNDVHFDDSMVSTLSVSSSAPVGALSPSVAGQKRHLDVGDEESAKRTRITPQPETGTINPNDITHVSDSAPVPSSSTMDKELRRELELEQTKARAKEYEDALTDCQREKEEQRDIILQLKRENEEVKSNYLNATARIRTQNETIAGLQNERNTLRGQLEEARQQLASSTVPEVAEREQLRRERDEALAKLQRVQKLREVENESSEFFRSEYQTASQKSTLLSENVDTLTQQVRELSKLKTGERDKVRQLSLTGAEEAYKDEMERLQIQLNDRNMLLQQKNDELKAIRGRQGVGTRAGSVPRSPRISGPGSRGGSPAPSGLGGHGRLGALRNINA